MFTPKYFPVKYFAPRYFPPSGFVVAGIKLEIPLFATSQDSLSGTFILDVGHILNVMDAERGLLCNIVKHEINIGDADRTINVNDTGANSVICNVPTANRVMVNVGPSN